MGASQSTDTTTEIKDLPTKQMPSSASGRKQSNTGKLEDDMPRLISPVESEEDSSMSSEDESADEDSYDADDDFEEEEEDKEWEERMAILRDARQLKQWAMYYAHPEAPVEVNPLAKGRNYFSRVSAPQPESAEVDEERTRILEDAKQLKATAMDYMHPERPVVTTDPCACGRNYFDRASAPQQESNEEAEERERILADAVALKKFAVDYMHPELPVKTTDSFACGRNFFSRPSAPQQESNEEAEERERILADAAAMKQLAVDYMHPELPVKTTDAFACGRNFFSRPSADEYEDEEAMDDRDEIMEDMAALKKLAVDYMHPERPVQMDPLDSCRNFFERPSAPQQESSEDMEERERILEDMAALKKLAVDYMHPELPVKTTDSFACGRNFFSRPSAPQQESNEEMEERERILADAAAMKQLAVDYMHPELPVKTSDVFACGRNFFSRPSADHEEDQEEREHILEDMAALKKLAVDYMHPELPVKTTDAFACGRNFFSRPSADEYEDDEAMDDRDEIMEDMAALKKLAVDYMHPERPVQMDPLDSCRNFFERPSAPQQESSEDMEERERILEDMAALKKLAVDYMHPELPVKTTDSFACGRSFFSRPSAPQQESSEDMEERERILADASAMKQLAVDYMHPELPVKTNDVFACGRNFFSRPSADHEEDQEEREHILEDMAALKKLAVDYMHPEKPVEVSDPTLFGRNYFDRPSAPGHEDQIHCHGSVNHLEHAAHHIDHDFEFQYCHDGDHHDDTSHGHSDHFDMDEDLSNEFTQFRQALVRTEPFKGDHPQEVVNGEDQEGKLSRSPSSVMLFEAAAN